VLPAAAKNLSALTSIRFLAALRVAMYHLVNWDHRTYWWRGLMGTPASVSYFFVSSGFLLTYTYSARFDQDEMNYGKFWLGRCARLLPVYFLGLLVALPVLLHTHTVAPGKMLLTVFIVVLSLALYKWVEAPLTAKLRKSWFHSAAVAPKYSE
jgi:peptidoglycan/LPS O-acetylase OafA/YrhL